MNDGQKMFLSFMRNICKEDRVHDMEIILADCFGAQDNGTFDKEYLGRVIPKLMDVSREECIPQLEQAMASFASKLN